MFIYPRNMLISWDLQLRAITLGQSERWVETHPQSFGINGIIYVHQLKKHMHFFCSVSKIGTDIRYIHVYPPNLKPYLSAFIHWWRPIKRWEKANISGTGQPLQSSIASTNACNEYSKHIETVRVFRSTSRSQLLGFQLAAKSPRLNRKRQDSVFVRILPQNLATKSSGMSMSGTWEKPTFGGAPVRER